MDKAIIKQEKSVDAGKPASRQSPIGWSSLVAFSRLLARQAAHEYLEHESAGTKTPCKHANTDIPASSKGADHETKD